MKIAFDYTICMIQKYGGKGEVVGKKLRDLNFPKTGIIGGVIRSNKPLIPRGDFMFAEKDRVIIVSKHESLHPIESMFKWNLI